MSKKPNSYSWNASDYAKNSSNQYVWAKELIPKLELLGNEAFLDIGCGDGKITAELAKCLPNGRAVGVDSSVEMINLANRNFPQQDYTNLTFQVMDARKLTFHGEFDRVFSNAALHWIPEQKTVLVGVAESLKNGGRLLFQMGGKGNAKDILGILDDMLVEAQWKGFFEGFTFPYAFCGTDEYRNLLIEAGLVPKRVELLPKVMSLKGAEGLAGWIRTTWLPYTQRLPLERRDGFVAEIGKRYLANHPVDAEDALCLSMVRLEVEAYKP
jgi:trans-aconitate 2-methyltransferase